MAGPLSLALNQKQVDIIQRNHIIHYTDTRCFYLFLPYKVEIYCYVYFADEITLYEAFKASEEHQNFQIYTKSNLPHEWHFDKEKVQPIMLVANEGYVFMPDFSARRKMLDEKGNREGKLENKYGCSGYDNRLDSMKTIMIAKGPSFKKQKTEDEKTKIQKWVHHNGKDINVVDVFSLLCHILNIPEPLNSQGSLVKLSWVLKYEPGNPLANIKKAYDYVTSPKNLPFARE